MAQLVERIERVGVVGCGTMGSGIAEIVATHGIPVDFVDIDEAAVVRGQERIRASVARTVARGRMSEAEGAALVGRIGGGTDWTVLARCDLIVEAVPEVLALKQDAFRRVDEVARLDAIVATNTSSLPVIDIAVHARRPDRVVGFHFFNPAPVMRLIELVRTDVTDAHAVDVARAFAERIGKSPVVVGDRRGFIANRLLFPYLNEAVEMVESGHASKEDVDLAMRLGAGMPMGPIALTDLVGIDTFVGIMDAIHAEDADGRFVPRPVLGQLVRAGSTGRKAGRGFSTYEAPGSSRVVPDVDARPPADPALVADWTTVGIVGTGTMAAGIAEACALAGFEVVVLGHQPERGELLATALSASLRDAVAQGRLTDAEATAALERVRTATADDELAGADLVIEAEAEAEAAADTGVAGVDHDGLARLERALGPRAILATSSLPVIDRALATDRPERVLGLHVRDTVAGNRLVEVARTVRTAPEVVEAVLAFVARIDAVGVVCGDRAGLIVDALLFPHLNDAVRMLESTYATAEDIDTAMRLGCGYPLGPFELMDDVGLDVTLAMIERLHAESRLPVHEPAPLLRHLVDAGSLGRTSGRGFRVHD